MFLFVSLIPRQSLMKQDRVGRGWSPPSPWKLPAGGGPLSWCIPSPLKAQCQNCSGFTLECGLGCFLKTPNVSPKNICHPPHLSLTGQWHQIPGPQWGRKGILDQSSQWRDQPRQEQGFWWGMGVWSSGWFFVLRPMGLGEDCAHLTPNYPSVLPLLQTLGHTSFNLPEALQSE